MAIAAGTTTRIGQAGGHCRAAGIGPPHADIDHPTQHQAETGPAIGAHYALEFGHASGSIYGDDAKSTEYACRESVGYRASTGYLGGVAFTTPHACDTSCH